MKTSNKLALSAFIILVALPALSFYINAVSGRGYSDNILTVIDSLRSDTVTVLQYSSPKSSPGLLYVTPARRGQHNSIVLNVQPEVRIAGDTLVISSDDPSAIYQGYVWLCGLREVRFGETVRTFATAPKVITDSLARDSVTTGTLQIRNQPTPANR